LAYNPAYPAGLLKIFTNHIKPTEQFEARIFAKTSMRQSVNPNEVATMAFFITSEFGAPVTGQSLSVCGGVETLR
jgi:enoyl-[acyl-carrier-protein] reductase (NADH)